ncbi:MAG: ABC transporter ATP-binding protein [Planctomycetota bacterium]|nr:ABC transporter ATP-binding protein [Planctomycetota bacterium]
MSDLIELQNIVKHYGKTPVLNDVSISLQPGVTGLLGPNGAGKSTLIKVILGLVRITSGTGSVMGLDLLRKGKQIRSLVGYMPEDDSYIAGMSGIEVVRYAACLSGMSATEGLRRAHEIMDYCDIDQERYRAIETYSTGMRQKTKVAQAIVADPPILIFDEPTSGLDPEARESMLNRVRNLALRLNKTAIVSTHILRDVQQICDHVMIMANGKMKISDRLENVHRPSSPNLFLTIRGDLPSFQTAMSRYGIESSLTEKDQVQVITLDGILPREVWKAALETGTQIQSAIPAKNSLETIFREAVGDDARAG